VAYQYVREPLTAAEADRLANACETPTERLIVWTLLDTGLRISELCNLTAKDVLWQQRQLRFMGKGGPYGKKSKVRVVPMSHRVRALMEHHFALEKAFPVKTRHAQDIVKAVANRAGLTKEVSPHVLRRASAYYTTSRRTAYFQGNSCCPGVGFRSWRPAWTASTAA
jgi:integrase/recombinase XerD